MISFEGISTESDVTIDAHSTSVAAAASSTKLSVVIPTRNEADNVEPLLGRLESALSAYDVEVIFVDDSDDETAARVRDLIPLCESDRFTVRLIERRPAARHGGLSGAVLDGVQAAKNRWVCVMDGDLQHPPSTIEDMINSAQQSGAQLVSASRYAATGSSSGLTTRPRRIVSIASGSAAKAMFGSTLSHVSDPMSGFFLVDTERLDLSRLRPRGYKILLEILISHPELRTAEVPFQFAPREHGDSKASASNGWQYARQLMALRRNGASRLTWRYDIHGILAVESDRRLPELEKFITRQTPNIPTITVRVGELSHLPLGESVDTTALNPIVGYRERVGFAMSLELGVVNTEVVVSRFVAKSPHVLYTNVVEPILRWRLVEFGYALIHAACFSDGEDAFLVTARTDTGKTTTMLKVLNSSNLSFISDDLIVVSDDGTVRTFPKPLTISAHTVHALRNTDLNKLERIALVPQSRIHSREGRLLAFIMTKYRLPVASINSIIQRLVPPPKFHVERLVRGVASQATAKARGMFIIQRGGVGDVRIATEEALEILLANCADAFGFPPYTSLERLLLSASDDDLRAKERAIIESAISSLPVLVMRSESLDWAERIPESVRDWRSVERDCDVAMPVLNGHRPVA